MPDDARVLCDVRFIDDEARLGEFANSLRVVSDSGDDVFLDFCLYSAQDNIAKVVARVRVHRSFMPLLVNRLQQGFVETAPISRVLSQDGILVMLPTTPSD